MRRQEQIAGGRAKEARLARIGRADLLNGLQTAGQRSDGRWVLLLGIGSGGEVVAGAGKPQADRRHSRDRKSICADLCPEVS